MDVASKLEMHSVGENMQAACRWLGLELPGGLSADEHASCRTLLFNEPGSQRKDIYGTEKANAEIRAIGLRCNQHVIVGNFGLQHKDYCT